MKGRKSASAPDVGEVQTRFENWRQNRKGKARIPDELWEAAVEVARRDGVNQTAAALHLDGGKPKRRMVATGGAAASGEPRPLHRLERRSASSQHPLHCLRHAFSDSAVDRSAAPGVAHPGSDGGADFQ